jgi:uncharacterized protein YxjI
MAIARQRGNSRVNDGSALVVVLARPIDSAEMKEFEIAQVLMSVGTVFEVRAPGGEDVLHTIRGELLSTAPKFHLAAGGADAARGTPAWDMIANFVKTKYDVQADGKEVATLTFPTVAIKKTLTLTLGEDTYVADGGVFKGVFRFTKEGSDDVVLEVSKSGTLRDTFLVKTGDVVPLEAALLSAAAIHSRFYEFV